MAFTFSVTYHYFTQLMWADMLAAICDRHACMYRTQQSRRKVAADFLPSRLGVALLLSALSGEIYR